MLDWFTIFVIAAFLVLMIMQLSVMIILHMLINAVNQYAEDVLKYADSNTSLLGSIVQNSQLLRDLLTRRH